MVAFIRLSSSAKDVMMQLFVVGPTWDGNLISKQGRTELVDKGLVFRTEGWQSLTEAGLTIAINADVSDWHDQRWYRKQRQLLSQ
jgi:hypothetical protein